MNEKLAIKYQKMTDQEIIKKFYAFPVNKLIFNVVSFICFCIGLLLPTIAPDLTSGDGFIYVLILFAIGTVCSAVSRMIFSNDRRKGLAQEIKNRSKEHSISDPYYYLFRREKELTGENKQKKISTIINILSIVFVVLNYLFSILSSLILLVFAAIPLMISAFCYLAYIIWSSGGGNGLALVALNIAKACTAPLKWAFKLVKIVLKLDVQKEDFSSVLSEVESYDSHKKPSRAEAELMIDSYINLNNICPAHCGWNGGLDVTIRRNCISVKGELVCNSSVYKYDHEVYQTVQSVTSEIERTLKSQIDKYLKDYPMAEKATFDINIEGRIG